MTRHRTTILISVILTVLPLTSFLEAKENEKAQAPISVPSCTQLPRGSGVVSRISKQNVITLRDGRQLKMANLYDQKKHSHSVIKKHLLEKTITFYASGRIKDRHNRYLVQIFYEENGQRVWLQERLIERGVAVPMALPNTRQCFLELLKIEQKVRMKDRENQNINKLFPIIQASLIQKLNEKPQGSFQIVAGKVHSYHRTAKNTYLNFSKNWRTDFTIIISNHLLKRKNNNWPNLKALKGKIIRVRGWLDHYNGPMIRLEVPEMLER